MNFGLLFGRRARWRRLASANALRVTAICSAFAGLIAAGAYAAVGVPSLLHSADISGGDGLPRAARGVPLVGSADLDPSDPALRFSETHVGHVLFTQANGQTCERMLLDNRTGLLHTAERVFCGQKAQQALEPESAHRLTTLRKAFER